MRTVLVLMLTSAVFFCSSLYSKTPEALEKRARSGNADAQYELGVEYFFGRRRPGNQVLAVYWFRRAADAGHAVSQYNLARCFERGWGCQKSSGMARRYYQKAMKSGLAAASLRYAELLYNGVPAEKGEYGDFPALKADPDAALQIMRQIAAVSESGKLTLARYLFKDAPKHGRELRTRLANYVKQDKVNPEALLLYSACLRSGIGGEIDIPGGIVFLQRAVAAGNSEALAQLAEILENGTGLPPDPGKALQLVRRAAEAGNQRALVNMGKRHLAGIGVDYDPSSAVKYFRRAAVSGYPPAHCALGDCFARGVGVEQNWKDAAENYRLAALGGDENGCWKLGDCFANGSGVNRNDAAAFFWYRRATEAGSVVGMRKMAIALLDGRGIRRNQEQGLKLLRRAAENGDRTAQLMLNNSGN